MENFSRNDHPLKSHKVQGSLHVNDRTLTKNFVFGDDLTSNEGVFNGFFNVNSIPHVKTINNSMALTT